MQVMFKVRMVAAFRLFQVRFLLKPYFLLLP